MASTRHYPVTTIVPPAQAIQRAQLELAAIKNGVPRALLAATKKTLTSARTIVADEMTDVLTAKRNNILRRMSVLIRPSAGIPEGRLRILGREIALVNFKHREVRGKRKGRKYGTSGAGQGVFYQVFRSGSMQRLPHAFKAKGLSDNVQIFERVKKGGKIGARAGRFPLYSRTGVSLLSVFRKFTGMEERAKQKVMEVFGEFILSQIDRLLGRSKASRGTWNPSIGGSVETHE